MKSKYSLALCAIAMLALPSLPAHAITGGVPARGKDGVRRSVVRVESTLGEVCSGVLIAPDIVLTAAHCVAASTTYSAHLLDERYRSRTISVTAILKHPSFVNGTTPHDQPGTDLALLRLSQNAPTDMTPALIAHDASIHEGIELYIAGYGTSSFRNRRSVRTLRIAPLVTLGVDQPPNHLVFAADRHNRGISPGASACLGDSGGPALMATPGGFAIGGIMSWAQGAQRAHLTPCGGITVITPLARHLGWIGTGIQVLHQ